MHLSLLETRIFNKFVEMEMERDELYIEFTKLDEPHEISSKWIEFAESCSKNLSSINNLASMAFDRLSNARAAEDKDNPIPLHTLLHGPIANQMMSLTDFQLNLSILSYVYSQVRNNGVFDHEPEDEVYTYYIQAKETLDTILYRIIDDELPPIKEYETLTPSPTNKDLLKILRPLLHLEHKKRLIPTLYSLPNAKEDPAILSKIGDYDRLQGETLLSHIVEIAEQSSKDFWWSDPISQLSIVSHAKEHFESVIELWSDIPGDLGKQAMKIENIFLPLVNAQINYFLSNHYRNLADYALESGDLKHHSIYLDNAIEKMVEIHKHLGQASSIPIDINKIINLDLKQVKGLARLSRLALYYGQTFKCLSNNDKEGALKSCVNIVAELDKKQSNITTPYLYGIGVNYATATHLLESLLDKDYSPLKLIDMVLSQFSYSLNVLSSILDEMNLKALKVNDDNPSLSYQQITAINEKVSSVEKAIELLPDFLEQKTTVLHRVHSMKDYLQSLLAENKIYLYADSNIVLDLILRAKAHYAAKKASKNLKQIDNKEMEELLNNRLIETKITGMITETNLALLGIQESYHKKVREVFSEIISFYSRLEKPPEFIIESVENQFKDMSDFVELLDLMEIDTQELISMKRDVSIKGNEVNWDFIDRRMAFIPATKKMFKAIKSIILAELNAILKKHLKSANHYNEAKSELYEISDILGKVIELLGKREDLHKIVYSMAIFCQENARSVEDRRKRKDVPYKEFVSVLDYLVLHM